MKNFKEDSLEDYSNELSDVYHFAKAKHDATGAIRKNSGLPYFVHPEMVAEVVAAFGGTDAQIEAALLHDTVEDTDVSVEELERLYGPEVAQIVAEVTNYKPDVEYYGKENYINHELMELSDDALLIKVADCVCNYLDNPKPGQAERLVRNLSYLIENRAELPDGVRRLLKSIPVLNDIFDLDKEEFEEPYIDDLEGYQRIVASKKMTKNKIKEAVAEESYHCFRVFNMHPDIEEKLKSLAKEEPDWLVQFTPQDKNYFLLTNSEVKSKDQLRELIGVEASYQMQLLF